MGWFDRLFRRAPVEEVADKALPGATTIPPRAGFEAGIDPGGITEYTGIAARAGGSDRRSQMETLFDTYRMCTWSYVSVNAIAKTITAGGLASDWDADDHEGDQDAPQKPPNVLAFERLLAYCNPKQGIAQMLRAIIVDLLVFGDAYIEVTWLAGIPVALYQLDAVNTHPLANEHGQVSGYVQITEFGQRANFDPHEVIHISYDSPRGGVFGMSPTEAAQLAITIWLFASATLKEFYRKGAPRDIHVDLPKDMSTTEVNRWVNQYMVRNIGPRNQGRPVTTKNGGAVKELSLSRVAEILATRSAARDEIVAQYGVPPAEAGIIESGNLGGGTGESQHKTFKVNTCAPVATLILEALNFNLGAQAFGIEGWSQKFADVDLRDSKVIEDIRDMRIRSGLYTLNKGRTEIGEPPVDGGDTAVLVDRQNLVRWRDMDAYSKAGIAQKLKGTSLEPDDPGDEDTPVSLIKPAPAPVPDVLKPYAGQDNDPADDSGGTPATNDAGPVKNDADGDEDPPVPPGKPKETTSGRRAEYRRRLAEALRDAGIPAA